MSRTPPEIILVATPIIVKPFHTIFFGQLLSMLDAVYVDAKDTKSVIAIKPKPPFKPVFQVAASREGSDIRIINEPLEGSSLFLVETGES